MKIFSKIVLAMTAFAAFGAGAQTVYSGQADQERRDRNREEALSKYRAGNTGTATRGTESRTTSSTSTRGESLRERGRDATQAARRGATKAVATTKRVTQKSADAVRRAGHTTAEKARDVTDRTNAKFGGPTGQGKANPQGINPVGVSSASPTAPSAGTTK
jgi:hypothetical protein